MEEDTANQIQFERYFSGSLAPSREVLEAINAGVADMGLVSGWYSPGKTPLLTFGKSAALFTHLYEGLMAFQDVINEVPAMRAELAAYNCIPLTTTGSSGYGIFTATPVNSLADLDGLKLRCDGPQAAALKEFGVVPVSMAGSEIFENMDQGIIDGCVYGPTAITIYGIQDAGKYYYSLPMGGSLSILGIRQQTWDKLPEDIQVIMQTAARQHPEAGQYIYEVEGDGKGYAIFEEKGIIITEPTAADVATLREMAKLHWYTWADDMEAKGLPGRQVVDTFVELVKKYEPLNPAY